jgi:hypothetical protein
MTAHGSQTAFALVVPAAAFAIGMACGALNTRLILSAAGRLAEGGRASGFVFSSLLRVGAFAILAVAFAAVGPWWASTAFIAGLFFPLAIHVVHMARGR